MRMDEIHDTGVYQNIIYYEEMINDSVNIWPSWEKKKLQIDIVRWTDRSPQDETHTSLHSDILLMIIYLKWYFICLSTLK